MASGEAPKNIRASLYIDGKPAENSIKGVGQVAQSLRKDLNNLTIGSQEWIAKSAEFQKVTGYLKEAKQQASGLKSSIGELSELQGVFASLGIGVGVGELISFGKQLTQLEMKADGIHMAFSKIGETTGYIEKLSDATNHVIADLDLEQIAIKANNANIPLKSMGMLLQFAAQRARDLGVDATEFTSKMIEGLQKGTPKAVAELGFNVSEVKREFKETGDMVEAVTNIIHKNMAYAGKDVEDFGDRVKGELTVLENLKDKGAGIIKAIFARDLADPEEVAKHTNAAISPFGELIKMSDVDLQKAIKEMEFQTSLYDKEYQKQQQKLIEIKKSRHLTKFPMYEQEGVVKDYAEQYQGYKNALSALNNEQNKRGYKAKDNSLEGIEQQITKLKDLQKQLSETSDEYKKYQVQIEALQKQENAITGKKEKADPAIKKAEEERKAALKSFQDLAEKYKQFEASELADSMAKNDKEVQSLKNKFNNEIDAQNAFLKQAGKTKEQQAAIGERVSALGIERDKAVASLRMKQEQEVTTWIAEQLEKQTGKYQTELEKQEEEINKAFDAKKKEVGGDPGDIELDMAREKALTQAKLNEHKRLLDEVKKLNQQYGEISGDDKHSDQVARINTEADQELAALKKSYSAQEQATQAFADAEAAIMNIKNAKLKKLDQEYYKQFIDAGLQAVDTIANASFQISAANRNAALTAQEKQLETERGNELANTNLTETQKAAINQRYDQQEAALKKQAFEADKQAQLEQAIINGAVAIAKTFAEYGFTPLGWLAAAGQAIATGAQVAVIEDQPTPAFAAGSYTNRDPAGYVSNATIFRNSASGRPFQAGEAGREWIAPNWMVHSPRYANIIGMLENERQQKRSYAAGGFNGSQGDSHTYINDYSELSQKLDNIHAAIRDQEITINYQYWQRETTRVAQIKTNAGG